MFLLVPGALTSNSSQSCLGWTLNCPLKSHMTKAWSPSRHYLAVIVIENSSLKRTMGLQSLPFPYLRSGCEVSNFYLPHGALTVLCPKAMWPWSRTSQTVPNDPSLSPVAIPGVLVMESWLTYLQTTSTLKQLPESTLLATFLPSPSSLQPPGSTRTTCSVLPCVFPDNYRGSQAAAWKVNTVTKATYKRVSLIGLTVRFQRWEFMVVRGRHRGGSWSSHRELTSPSTNRAEVTHSKWQQSFD